MHFGSRGNRVGGVVQSRGRAPPLALAIDGGTVAPVSSALLSEDSCVVLPTPAAMAFRTSWGSYADGLPSVLEVALLQKEIGGKGFACFLVCLLCLWDSEEKLDHVPPLFFRDTTYAVRGSPPLPSRVPLGHPETSASLPPPVPRTPCLRPTPSPQL